MKDLLIFLLSSLGATMIITGSFLFKSIREWAAKKNKYLGKLFSCTQCMGFWMGAIIKFYMIIKDCKDISKIPILNFGDIIIYGFVSSIFCYVFYLIIKPLVQRYD